MTRPSNCPYKNLTAAPCWNCNNYIPDTDDCKLNYLTQRTVGSTQFTCYKAQSYEERLKQYYADRAKLLELSKDALVDLLIKMPLP